MGGCVKLCGCWVNKFKNNEEDDEGIGVVGDAETSREFYFRA